jgi:hypothetical protein
LLANTANASLPGAGAVAVVVDSLAILGTIVWG